MLRNTITLLVSMLIATLLLEVGIVSIVKLRDLPIIVPDYYYGDPPQQVGLFWSDISPEWGVWHEPNARHRHTKTCFDVSYEANEYGARDKSRAKNSVLERSVVLGDSMVEGTGVSYGERMTEKLEEKLGREVLNFGIAGDVGTTQYYLIYKHLASTFSHDTVFVSLFPNNDFKDDSLAFGKRALWNRYRPYWVGEFPNYELQYYKESLDDESTASGASEQFSFVEKVKETLRSFTYTYNALSYFQKFVLFADTNSFAQPGTSSFYAFKEEEILRAQYSFQQIKSHAGERNVVVLILPVAPDFEQYDGQRTTPLGEVMLEFGKANGIEVVDLLPLMASRIEDVSALFHDCDGHWTHLGHEIAADAVIAALKE